MENNTLSKNISYLPRGQLLLNAIFSRMVRLGIIPGATLIEVPGRKSGILRTTPVFMLNYAGQRWLVAGFEQADWVKNLRAAGGCLLIHDRREEPVRVHEVKDVARQCQVLQAYVRRAPGGRRGFAIKPNASLEEFVAIAPLHPVFQVV
jgi:deazaflavin-dependent oxidoreductase (nitroreductase family)